MCKAQQVISLSVRNQYIPVHTSEIYVIQYKNHAYYLFHYVFCWFPLYLIGSIVQANKQYFNDLFSRTLTAYLGDILEDLGHCLSDGLKNILTLLKLPAKDYWVASTGCPQKMVSTIRQMRNLGNTK